MKTLSSKMKMDTMQHWFFNENGKSFQAGFSVFIFVEFTESRFVDEGKSVKAFVPFLMLFDILWSNIFL